MKQALVDYYRCPEESVEYTVSKNVSQESGFFRFGKDVLCYGQCATGAVVQDRSAKLHDALEHVSFDQGAVRLPFDPQQVIENLRRERYVSNSSRKPHGFFANAALRQAYYLVRPLLPVSVRSRLQKWYLHGWEKTLFPQWPVDRTVESIHQTLLVQMMKATGVAQVPFIWFWPEGARGALIMTHDVETSRGRDFCSALMDINESFGIKSSFQVIPEKRYEVPASFLEEIRARGFEVNVHDLNHDGHLFAEREEFLRRARKINQHVREFGARGFRSGVLYRNLEWYDAFVFSYDMSVPNVAHLDPQRGGCCTVMPYFLGHILELPVTTTQDYSLFHILGEYSIDLWKTQIDLILGQHGLISFITHPDYIMEKRARSTYTSLLKHLAHLRSTQRIWFALPGEVDRWWRDRSSSRVVRDGNMWRIEGPAKERACLAFALLQGDRVVYRVESNPAKQVTGACER